MPFNVSAPLNARLKSPCVLFCDSKSRTVVAAMLKPVISSAVLLLMTYCTDVTVPPVGAFVVSNVNPLPVNSV
ncbi:hypothetical protein D3C72_2426060 [compost metagenome]